MKPAPFEYVVAESVDHAVALKREHGEDARFLAGGQSLVPAMNFRLAQPRVLIDLNGIAGLDGVAARDGGIEIGALTRHRTVERDAAIARHAPLFAEAAPNVAHPQIRTRGTLGGNLSQADPASEFPAVTLALGARLRAQSAAGSRWIAAEDFFIGVFATALAPDEMLTAIGVPPQPPRTGTSFLEIARRRGDYAVVGAAAVVTLDAAGRCAGVRVALCGAADRPVLLASPARALHGERGTEAAIRAAAADVGAEIDPPANVHATSAYRRHLAGVLVQRTLTAAFARAQVA
jgi:aerobic carbon-monoxide dehydrogenase medium subunit